MNFSKLLIIAIGGSLGSISRYITVKSVDEKLNTLFPYGTLTVNVVGSFLIGVIYAVALRKVGMSENWRLFLGTGFCGGFTTFSAFAWENVNLFNQKLFSTAFFYISGSLILGIFAVALGMTLGKYL